MVPFTLPLCCTVLTQFTWQCRFWNPFEALVDFSAACRLFRKLVCQLVPVMSSVCLDPVEIYFPVSISISIAFILMFSMRYVWFFRFLSDSNVIRLSVDINTVLPVFFKFCTFSGAFNVASYSAWLFEHRPFNLYLVVSVRLSSVNMAIPDPTPCPLLLPSVCVCMCTYVCHCDFNKTECIRRFEL